MKSKFFLLIILAITLLFGNLNSSAQDVFNYKGYVANLESIWMPEQNTQMLISGTTQNRFDFSIYPADNLVVSIGLRNIVEYGNTVQQTPGYAGLITKENGFFNFTKTWRTGDSYVLYSTIDRFNLFYSNDNFEIQLGRQRINRGINFVWTPNDIFNSASYLNFDYEEKSGSDAIRGEYYFNYSSSIEYVYKLDWNNNITSSLMFRFNAWDFDFQFFSGMMIDDYVFGGGWTGNILSSNFSGEFTYFRDKNNFADTTGQLVASLGWTYTFAVDFYTHFEFLYNSRGTTGDAGGVNNILNHEYNAKNLSPAKYSLFAEIAYQVTPLTRIDLSAILNPSDKSFYLGPFATFSVAQNFDLLLGMQFFSGNRGTEWGDFGEFYFVRMKWSF